MQFSHAVAVPLATDAGGSNEKSDVEDRFGMVSPSPVQPRIQLQLPGSSHLERMAKKESLTAELSRIALLVVSKFADRTSGRWR